MSKLIPTSEQSLIIAEASLGKNLAIKAFAGAAKTATCIMVAEKVNKNSLYVCFNKSIAEEAVSKFPKHVVCKTMHSLAWKAVIRFSTSKFAKKLQGFFRHTDMDELQYMFKDVPEEIWSKVKIDSLDAITKFTQSSSKDLKEFLIENEFDKGIHELVLAHWANVIDQDRPHAITHDVYLKLFQLSNPTLPYEVIYLDEAQDSSPVVLDIVLAQKHAQIIIVGDPYQAIYEWRGAVNAFECIPGSFTSLYLSESFRFTQSIANKATALLAYVGNTIPIIGKADELASSVSSSKAFIVRNNATLVDYLLQAYKDEQKVKCITDLKPVWSKLYHIQALRFKSVPKYPDKELSQYRTYKEIVEASASNVELKKLINLSTKLTEEDGLTANINKIKNVLVESGYDFTLTTAHKSKGLEWDEVTLAPDLFYIPEESENTIEELLLENQTLNLLYVALTRAKYKVNVPSIIQSVIDGRMR